MKSTGRCTTLCIVKRALESEKVVAGGGAGRLRCRCTSRCCHDARVARALAIAEFAEALLVIPKVLSVTPRRIPRTRREAARATTPRRPSPRRNTSPATGWTS